MMVTSMSGERAGARRRAACAHLAGTPRSAHRSNRGKAMNSRLRKPVGALSIGAACAVAIEALSSRLVSVWSLDPSVIVRLSDNAIVILGISATGEGYIGDREHCCRRDFAGAAPPPISTGARQASPSAGAIAAERVAGR